MAGERVTRQLAQAGHAVVLPLANAAGMLVSQNAWFAFGYRNADDFAREALQRSGRWLRDLARLHTALDAFPALARAMDGADGSPPLGSKAALCLARVATPENIVAWIARARRLSLKDLQQAVAARGDVGEPGSEETGPEEPGAGDGSGELEAGESLVHSKARVSLRLAGPPELRLAFDAVKSLHAAVVGREQSLEAFVEAMLGEAISAGWTPLDAFQPRLQERGTTKSRDAANGPAARERTSGAVESQAFSPSLCRAQKKLDAFLSLQRRLDDLKLPVASGVERNRHLRRLLAVFKRLIRLQDGLEIVLADLLLEMHERKAWKCLGYGGLETYAEECLGLGRSTTRRRVSLARRLRRHGVTRQAYESGTLGEEAAQWVVRRLETGAGVETEILAHAATTSVKRLRDEAALLRREDLLRQVAGRARGAASLPDDAAWHASLERRPGGTRSWVVELEHGLLERVVRGGPVSTVPLVLSLSPEMAAELLGCVEAVRRELGELGVMTPAAESRARPSVRLARWMVERGDAVPSWLGLLGLLEECLWVWDEPRGMPRRDFDRVYRRDGYRCMAPGCTARSHLETHHLVYRSQGGEDAMQNLLVLCRFHHQQGEHGTLARARGQAPLGVTWRLGDEMLATGWRNERRLF